MVGDEWMGQSLHGLRGFCRKYVFGNGCVLRKSAYCVDARAYESVYSSLV